MQRTIIISFISLALNLSTLGQQLPKGRFGFADGYTYIELHIKGKSGFDYSYSSCGTGKKGSGSYLFENKQLVLTFDNPDRDWVAPVFTMESKPTSGDSSSLNFTFIHKNNKEPISNVVVKYLHKTRGIYYGASSNYDGQATLSVLTSSLPLDIEISHLQKVCQVLRIDTGGHYSISIPLNLQHDMVTLVKGDTMILTVDTFNQQSLALKWVDQADFITLKRKRKNYIRRTKP